MLKGRLRECHAAVQSRILTRGNCEKNDKSHRHHLNIGPQGVGSLVGGQLTEVLKITEVFFCTAVFGVVAASCIMAIKAAFGRKWERKVLDEKEIVMQQMYSVKSSLKDVEVQREDKECQITRL